MVPPAIGSDDTDLLGQWDDWRVQRTIPLGLAMVPQRGARPGPSAELEW